MQIHLATRKAYLVVGRDRRDWAVVRSEFVGDNCSYVYPDNDAVWVGLNLGHFGVKLRRVVRQAVEEMTCPAFPADPAAAGLRTWSNEMTRRPVPMTVQQIWSMARDGMGRLWCGTIPGALFYSDDDGRSWAINSALWNREERGRWFGGGYDEAGIHSILPDPRNGRALGVGVSCGGYWKTADSGQTWALCCDGMRAAYMPPDRAGDPSIQDPHLVVRSPADPRVLWTQHHNGIFKSEDDGGTWREITGARPSTFGFAVAAHPTDPGTAWFVPAERDEKRVPVGGGMSVSRTLDGGHSFESLRTGLPQHDAYDIVFRHALAVSQDGGTLAMGTTTGHLYTSDDGGETWHLTLGNLPPIHSVAIVG